MQGWRRLAAVTPLMHVIDTTTVDLALLVPWEVLPEMAFNMPLRYISWRTVSHMRNLWMLECPFRIRSRGYSKAASVVSLVIMMY